MGVESHDRSSFAAAVLSVEPAAVMTMDQKERYRRHASLCYEVAANMTGERAESMTRLGDTYAALAVDSDQPPNAFVPATKYAEPRCKKCGKEMRLTHSLPRTDIVPAMQAFRCDACGETMIWKSTDRSRTSAGQTKPAFAIEANGDRQVTRFIAVSFSRAAKGLAPGPTIQCPDAETAIQRARLLTREQGIAGAVAFSRRSDPVTGASETAVVLKTFGEIPKNFDIG
jgi:hypothetical protein